jgi:hypothetical protein
MSLTNEPECGIEDRDSGESVPAEAMVLSEKDPSIDGGMFVYVYTEVNMRTYALLVSVCIMVAGMTGGAAAWPGDQITQLEPLDAMQVLRPSLPSTIGIVRLIRVTVDPAMPSPTDPVSVTIAAESSDPYLVLDQTTVSRVADDVAIDLYWHTNRPPVSSNGIDLLHGAQASLGYGVEQITPTLSSIWAGKTYETTAVLGTFGPGMHTIQMHSHGAMEGEAFATFQVRDLDPIPVITADSIWSRLGLAL